MTALSLRVSRLRGALSGRAGAEAELADEVQTHLDLLADGFVARGMSPEEARLAARRAFGGVDQLKARWRDQRGLPSLSALVQGLSLACRLAASRRASMNVGDGWRVPERYAGTYVTANCLSAPRIQPVLGRGFTARDDQAGVAEH